MNSEIKINPELDLVLERTADVKPELVWRAWTEPKLLMQWFCPLPWKTVECEMDLKPGGVFSTAMRGPEGQEFHNTGCFLQIEKGRKIVWTSAMLPGFRPQAKLDNGANMAFTAIILIEPNGNGTKYTAIAIQKDAEDRARHEKMGLHEGWGKAFDQLVEMTKKM
ncbi:MAG: SRPBCC family protein [Pseudobdellovibrionaceae bacterium]